ncbi:selenophosphate synthase [Limnochorda pilosa]|uniref:Selenide, water dikinase n=1 Tax=Limnochorda pilosa TaxID=1555112 RepID=A0A0K2SPN0_LIMPI|nr:selenophosphate synthase [Limnochorda pilosa]
MGNETLDDAAVYRLDDERALVQTVDFFTPIVDDPYLFGRIAAANALSDVYAMGGRPLTALALVGFPVSKLPLDVLRSIMAGGADVLREAGCALVGGHTIDDPEPKFGLAVTGMVAPDRFLSNAGARPGDVLVLTKPIGTGLISTALKRDGCPPDAEEAAVRVMTALNRAASEAALAVGVDACTDVTGFGLLGHLYEMVTASGVAAEVSAEAVPLLPHVEDLARRGFIAGGTRANQQYLRDKLAFGPRVDGFLRLVLVDAMTSGGLLLAVRPERTQGLLTALRERGVEEARVIGRIVAEAPVPITVT